eukprot:TRINITY_DN6729_c0_g1_i1.p1 TRINITY_DN6729_c0_g1~~TRINITY_DN6729_c0_g1_i1.p1  ORF type:complete len:298 (-),score=52.03 TRINITY_DN6729_c0_g1_i1:71-964(-)
MSIDHIHLLTPSLEDICKAISTHLPAYFEDVHCDIVECPNLTELGVCVPGLSGKNEIIDLGVLENLMLPERHHTFFDLEEVYAALNLKERAFLGCAAARHSILNNEGELIVNDNFKTKQTSSYLSHFNPKSQKPELFHYPSHKIACLSNMYATEGLPGKVVQIRARVRKQEFPFAESVRRCLKTIEENDNGVGLVGVYTLTKGKGKCHAIDVLPPMEVTAQGLMDFLPVFEVSAPITCACTMISNDKFRSYGKEHSHGFNLGIQEGGHLRNDTTPHECEYVGYFVPAYDFFQKKNPF